MDPTEKDILETDTEIGRLRLKSNLKEKLLGRALQESENLSAKLARKQEELRELNVRLENAKNLLKKSFRLYVGPQVVDEILKNSSPVVLRGERKTVTVLFSDVRGFTALAERFDPEDLVSFLNSYLSAMIEIIYENEGTLDKFMGDAILAFFGAPVSFGDDALRAVKAAVTMQQKLRALNRKWEADGKPAVEMGIGISTGEVVVGNIGSEKRLEYTVIGQDVNYAQRIEALTKELPCDVLVAESTFREVESSVLADRFGPVPIRGSQTPMIVYGIKGLS